MNTKHTPGPWKLRKDYAITAHCDETETHEPIARAYGDGSIENLHANSQLIAAAPELLKALKQTLDLAIGHACEARKINADECESWPWVQRARAAIRKATGGAK